MAVSEEAARGNLTARGLVGVGALVAVLWLIIFLPSGSLAYWQGWAYWVVFSTSVSAISVYFLKKDPRLIESRLKSGPVSEEDAKQRTVQALVSVFFVMLFVVSALDHRFLRSSVPDYISVAADTLVALGLLTIFLVFKENTYTSVVIEVTKGQGVISTGPYGVVRHPMYSGALLMLLFTPLALGSLWGVLPVLPISFVLAFRLVEEEKFLAKNLPGYVEFCKKTRYRLVPFVW